MHPKISHFPRNIFYKGALLDGPNVKNPNYGSPLIANVTRHVPAFSPFSILDLDSQENRSGGPSLSNASEAKLAVYLVNQLYIIPGVQSSVGKIAVISPYSEQVKLLRRLFENSLGPRCSTIVEINTVDGFQGREAKIVIFSAVRAAGSHGIGFLADVRRMNVAMTRAKHFLFMIARCKSVVVNPYWSDLVAHARETKAVVKVPMIGKGPNASFGAPSSWKLDDSLTLSSKPSVQQNPMSSRAEHAQSRAKSHEKPRENGAAVSIQKPLDPRRRVADQMEAATNQPTAIKPAASKAPQDPRKRGYEMVLQRDKLDGKGMPSDPRKRQK